jgi:hypothetical protein
MKTTNDLRPFRTLLIALLALGCAPQPSSGGEGQPCTFIFHGHNVTVGCNAGLLCLNFNSLCVRPHSQAAGGPCGDPNGDPNGDPSDFCVEGLICGAHDSGSGFQTCGGPLDLGLGAVCGGPNDCASGLACLPPCDLKNIPAPKNIPVPVCGVPYASNPCGNPQDAADAMVGDGSGPDVDGGADF